MVMNLLAFHGRQLAYDLFSFYWYYDGAGADATYQKLNDFGYKIIFGDDVNKRMAMTGS